MYSVNAYEFTEDELEKFANSVKEQVLQSMWNEKFITEEQYNEYVQNYVIMHRNRSNFGRFFTKLVKLVGAGEEKPTILISKLVYPYNKVVEFNEKTYTFDPQ